MPLSPLRKPTPLTGVTTCQGGFVFPDKKGDAQHLAVGRLFSSMQTVFR